MTWWGKGRTAGWKAGVGGPEDDGEGESTIHILQRFRELDGIAVNEGTMLPVRLGCDELRDRMGQGRVRIDIEYRKRVFSIVHTSCGKDDGDEMGTGVIEQRS